MRRSLSSLTALGAAGALTAALLAFPCEASAQVSKPHPGMTLVEHTGQGALVALDLCSPGASVEITRYADRMATAPEWATPKGVEAATNGDFFDFPGWTYVIGRARGDGQDWPANAQAKETGRPYWQFGPGIAAGVPDGNTPPHAGVTQIVGGHNVIVSGGKTTGPWAPANDGALLNTLHQRTGFGISADRRTVYSLATTDSITAQTLVDRLLAWSSEGGASPVDFATNMDGGGSSQLYVKGRGAIVPSTRQVNDHVGLLAKGTGPSPMCLPKFAASFKTQSFPLAPKPLALVVGQTVDGSIDLLNTGTSTWMPNVTKLAPIPRDKPSDAGGAGWLSPTRVSTVTAPVKPGAVGHFDVKLAPTKAGEWTQHFGLVEEGVAWFADPTLGGGPADDVLAVHLVVAPGPDGADGGGSGVAGTPGGAAGSAGPAGGPADAPDGGDGATGGGTGCTVATSPSAADLFTPCAGLAALALALGLGRFRRARRPTR